MVATILIVFVILVALLRAVVAPLYLIGSVLLSYLSAMGLGVLVFQIILGQYLHWSLPGLSFILLVAVGADYNMLLISRIRDESPHRGARRCHPYRGYDRWRDHIGRPHLRRLDVRPDDGQHLHHGRGRFHPRDGYSDRHLHRAHHHSARLGRDDRPEKLVALAPRKEPASGLPFPPVEAVPAGSLDWPVGPDEGPSATTESDLAASHAFPRGFFSRAGGTAGDIGRLTGPAETRPSPRKTHTPVSRAASDSLPIANGKRPVARRFAHSLPLFDLSGVPDPLTDEPRDSAPNSRTSTSGNGKRKSNGHRGHSLPLFGHDVL